MRSIPLRPPLTKLTMKAPAILGYVPFISWGSKIKEETSFNFMVLEQVDQMNQIILETYNMDGERGEE
ncbi:hypothetical protein J6590_081238 [Homalodisca vitripennis]|nr:hypothetical protein J6590_081238 [Homalodisca vitripennis]